MDEADQEQTIFQPGDPVDWDTFRLSQTDPRNIFTQAVQEDFTSPEDALAAADVRLGTNMAAVETMAASDNPAVARLAEKYGPR